MSSFGLGFIFMSVLALSGISAEQRGNATGLFILTRESHQSMRTRTPASRWLLK